MKKYLFICLFLLCTNVPIPAIAADECVGVWIRQYRHSSPPGDRAEVIYGVYGPANHTAVYLNGSSTPLSIYTDVTAPAIEWAVWYGSVLLPYGSYTLRASWDSCTLNFTVTPPPTPPPPPPLPPAPTANTAITAAAVGSVLMGYNVSGALGSISNPFLSDGKRIARVLDLWSGTLVLGIDGFTSDPGKSYINSITISSCTSFSGPLPTGPASYMYDSASGTAQWFFPMPVSAVSPYGHSCMDPLFSTSYNVSIN